MAQGAQPTAARAARHDEQPVANAYLDAGERARDLDDKVFRLRLQRSMGQTESGNKIQPLRRELARIKTVLQEKGGPERVRGLVIEMPVLDHALIGCAIAFTPKVRAVQAEKGSRDSYARFEGPEARAGELLGVAGEVRRSAPMLLDWFAPTLIDWLAPTVTACIAGFSD